MIFNIEKSNISGITIVPPSKSHTIRSIIISTLADGKTIINSPLKSMDIYSTLEACIKIGAEIDICNKGFIIKGTNGNLKVPLNTIDVGNSGTSLRFLTGICSLIDGISILTGDNSIKNRPIQPLLDSLNYLGADCRTISGNGNPPIVIKGKIRGGTTSINGFTSQYTSSLLICSPLANNYTIIKPINLQEKPYVDMTLEYLSKSGIKFYKNNDYSEFIVPGRQNYKSFRVNIPSDFSSGAFLLAAASIKNSDLTIKKINLKDIQGDKKIIKILRDFGTNIKENGNSVSIKGSNLKGIEVDLSDNPDLLPILSVVGCCAKGKTILKNIEHARIKESDRISVMTNELQKMGAKITEEKDKLIIKNSNLKGTKVHGYNDHRIVMSLAIAGLVAKGKTTVDTVESIYKTFPNFMKTLRDLGAKISMEGNT